MLSFSSRCSRIVSTASQKTYRAKKQTKLPRKLQSHGSLTSSLFTGVENQVSKLFSSSSRPRAVLSPRLGQPSSATHPHLLKDGEVTPFATKEEYKARREKLMSMLPEGSFVVIPAAKYHYMTNDIPYVYRQNTDFSYLCGVQEPGSVLVLYKTNSGKVVFNLFLRERTAHSELWDGPRTGVERAHDAFGCDSSMSTEHITVLLGDLLDEAKCIYFRDIESDVSDKLKTTFDSLTHIPRKEIKEVMCRLRLTKTESEIKMMRKSCSISAKAFIETIKATKPVCSEHIMSAKIEYECRIRGSQRLAYPPVVATGISCNTLHYVMNDSISKDGDLLLMDAGGEYFDYASDITRTWPTNGKFSPSQRHIYEAVLRTQKIVIKFCKPTRTLENGKTEAMTLAKLQMIAMESIMNELAAIGIKDVRKLTECYPHMIGHFLGMDVHDVSSISYNEPLQPGMIITVEPGLYMPEEEWVPEAFRGIGVRIEDDVLITTGEPEILTHEAPKEVDDLENIIGANPL